MHTHTGCEGGGGGECSYLKISYGRDGNTANCSQNLPQNILKYPQRKRRGAAAIQKMYLKQKIFLYIVMVTFWVRSTVHVK